jgi:hypothetical protein
MWATVRGWNWLEIVQALAAVWVAWVGTKALKTWKEQSKAERQGKLLDDLIEAVHEYLSLINSPLASAEFVKIGIDSHEPIGPSDDPLAGAIAYIKAKGTDDSIRLFGAIRECRVSRDRIRSLVVKGQVLRFKNYSRGYNSATAIEHQLGKLEAIAAVIASPSLNWGNPIARKQVEKILAIDVHEIRSVLETQHLEFLSFVKDAYAQIYR